MKQLALVAILVVAPTATRADKGAADACAAGLPADAQAIYAASAPGVGAASDKFGFVKSKVTGLVLSGTIARASAKQNAQAAGECLKKLKP